MQDVKETKEITRPGYKIEYDPKLTEEVVNQEIARLEQEGEMRIPDKFRSACDPIYDKYPIEDRNDIGFDDAFCDIYKRFFSLLGFEEIILSALAEHPIIDEKVGEVIVRKTSLITQGQGEKEQFISFATREEEANLLSKKIEDEARGTLSCISLSINPESFNDKEALKRFLRHELMHVTDMLDPQFSYEITKLGINPSEECIIKNHYSLIWDIYIDQRLEKAGRQKTEDRIQESEETSHKSQVTSQESDLKEKSREEFNQTYRSLPIEERIAIFEGLWQVEKLTHPQILAAAKDPARLLDFRADLTPEQIQKKKEEKKKKIHLPGMICPVCKFPTHNWIEEESLLKEVIEQVKKDAPAWDQEDGICQRCDEVYRAIVGKW